MEAIESLEMTLTEYEKQIVKACKAPLPRDVESLNSLVMNHKDFESNLHSQEPLINNAKALFANIPNKTANEQEKLDKVLDQWDRIWSYSQYYVERLKTVELTLSGLEEVTVVVTEFEMKLASYDSMPSDMDNLRKAHDDLMTLEAEIQEKQVNCISHPMASRCFYLTANHSPAGCGCQLSSAPQSHVSFSSL